MSVDLVNSILSVLVIIGQVFIACAIVYLLFFRNHTNKAIDFISCNAILLGLVVALVATSGSLYYSEIAGFTPCDLCWFQRIFMYPQVILLGLAWWKKEDSIINYSLAMIGAGTLISTYHNYIYFTAQRTNFCTVTSCTQVYVVGFGYITIPVMALTAFLMIALLLLLKKKIHK